jgi:hypothetical protein
MGIGPEPVAREDACTHQQASIQLAHGSMRNSHGWRQNDASPSPQGYHSLAMTMERPQGPIVTRTLLLMAEELHGLPPSDPEML